jgi:hypothetical protein
VALAWCSPSRLEALGVTPVTHAHTVKAVLGAKFIAVSTCIKNQI